MKWFYTIRLFLRSNRIFLLYFMVMISLLLHYYQMVIMDFEKVYVDSANLTLASNIPDT